MFLFKRYIFYFLMEHVKICCNINVRCDNILIFDCKACSSAKDNNVTKVTSSHSCDYQEQHTARGGGVIRPRQCWNYLQKNSCMLLVYWLPLTLQQVIDAVWFITVNVQRLARPQCFPAQFLVHIPIGSCGRAGLSCQRRQG